MLKAAAVALLALATACSSAGPESTPRPAISASTPNPNHVSQTVFARMDMKVTGARTLDVQDAEVKLRIVEIAGDNNPQIVHFFSVSSAEPLKLDDKHFVQWDADLAPGLYTGPGSYKLTNEKPVVNGTQTSLSSAAYVYFLDLQPAPAGPKFDQILEPCTLSTTAGGAKGSVTCPSLGSAQHGTVALRWSWERS